MYTNNRSLKHHVMLYFLRHSKHISVCRITVLVCGRGMTLTYLLCRTHQPQWGSPEPRHVLQLLYWEQLSTGRRLTWNTWQTLNWHYLTLPQTNRSPPLVKSLPFTDMNITKSFIFGNRTDKTPDTWQISLKYVLSSIKNECSLLFYFYFLAVHKLFSI